MKQAEKKIEDGELVKRAQSGDKAAEEELLYRYVSMVRAIARGYFLAGGETEDLIQEGMIGLYSAIRNYSSKKSNKFYSFAYACVSHRILDAVRIAAKKGNLPLNKSLPLFAAEGMAAEEEDPLECMIRLENNREFISKTAGALSDLEYRVIMLYVEGRSSSEICAATGKSAKSVDNALQRGKKKLSCAYEKQSEEQPKTSGKISGARK